MVTIGSFVSLNFYFSKTTPTLASLQAKMSVFTLFLFLSAATFASCAIRNEFEYVYDCIPIISQEMATIESLTFLCDNKYREITYFQPDVLKKCSNEDETFRTCNYIKSMHFHQCQMDHIPYHIFAAYRLLITLDISSMALETLRSDFFVGATELKSLNASGNYLRAIRVGQFSSANKLETVDLSYNKIDHIDENAFDVRSAQLATIDLSHNFIQQIGSMVFRNLTRLQTIYLSHNNLTNISSGLFSYQTELNTLDLSYNQLKTIDLKAILRLRGKIETINVMANQLTAVDNFERTSFPHLKWIEVHGNQLDCKYNEQSIPFTGFSCDRANSPNLSRNMAGFSSSSINNHHFGLYLTMFFSIFSLIVLIVVAYQVIQMRTIVRNVAGMSDCHYTINNDDGEVSCTTTIDKTYH